MKLTQEMLLELVQEGLKQIYLEVESARTGEAAVLAEAGDQAMNAGAEVAPNELLADVFEEGVTEAHKEGEHGVPFNPYRFAAEVRKP